MKTKFFAKIFVFAFFAFSLSAEGTENQKQFIKGNLQDKTAAVKKAQGAESIILSKNAIQFAINYRPVLGPDRDLSALAVSGVLSLPEAYINNSSKEEQASISDDFYKLYTGFDDLTLKISILNRIPSLEIPEDNFVEILNDYLINNSWTEENSGFYSTVFKTLGQIGNDKSFSIIFSKLDFLKNENSRKEAEDTLSALLGKSINQGLNLIKTGKAADLKKLFELSMKIQDMSSNFKAEIAENVLLRTIMLSEDDEDSMEDLISLELDSIKILTDIKWTKASKTAIAFFRNARLQYEAKTLKEDDFSEIITDLKSVAPLDSVAELTDYLNEINKNKANGNSVPSDSVILAIINTLGAVGDKQSFDTLLAVTYCRYPETIITAARNALQELKW